MHDPMALRFEYDEKTMSHFMKGPSQETVTQFILRKFYQDREHKIRNALIELGWTPPPADFKRDAQQ